MPVVVERFWLGVLTALFVANMVANPMGLNLVERIGAGTVIAGLALMAGGAVQRWNQTPKAVPSADAVVSEAPAPSLLAPTMADAVQAAHAAGPKPDAPAPVRPAVVSPVRNLSIEWGRSDAGDGHMLDVLRIGNNRGPVFTSPVIRLKSFRRWMPSIHRFADDPIVQNKLPEPLVLNDQENIYAPAGNVAHFPPQFQGVPGGDIWRFELTFEASGVPLETYYVCVRDGRSVRCPEER